jgi:hypothetical protein
MKMKIKGGSGGPLRIVAWVEAGAVGAMRALCGWHKHRQSTTKTTAKKITAMLATALIVLLLELLLLMGAFWAISPGKPKPYLDQNGQPLAGSLAEKVFVDIGGTRQGMFIKSKDARQQPSRLHRLLGLGSGIFRAAAGAGEGFLSIRGIGPQPLV